MALHTLIVDDDAMVVYAMKRTLQKNNFFTIPSTFENGLTALNHLKECYNEDDCFVIFLDINMPVLNGWQFLEAIGAFAATKNAIVFIITSSIDDADINRANKNPFVKKFVPKPVTTEMINSLGELLQDRGIIP